jgi:hypothetical protein
MVASFRRCLLVMLLCGLSGCGATYDPIQRTYYRYVNRNSPPLEELYVATRDGSLHLTAVYYDSDRNGKFDRGIYFDRRNGHVLSETQLVPAAQSVAAPWEHRMKMVASIDEAQREICFEEPPNVRASNDAAFSSVEYKKALLSASEPGSADTHR